MPFSKLSLSGKFSYVGERLETRSQTTNFSVRSVKKKIYYPRWKQGQSLPDSLQTFGL